MFDFDEIPEDLGGPNLTTLQVLAEAEAAPAAHAATPVAHGGGARSGLRGASQTAPGPAARGRRGPEWAVGEAAGALEAVRRAAADFAAGLRATAEPTEPLEPSPRSGRLCALRRLIAEHGLARDSSKLLDGGAQHLRGGICSAQDATLFSTLRGELGKGIRPFSGNWALGNGGSWRTPWRNGMGSEQVEDLQGRALPGHAFVLGRLEAAFNVEVQMWWTNFYEDGAVGCEFHHDGHGPGNVTVGASFGAARDLTFQHRETGQEVAFPQGNGDIFAFDERVDSAFMHGVYPLDEEVGPRISVIVMGRLRSKLPLPEVMEAWRRFQSRSEAGA